MTQQTDAYKQEQERDLRELSKIVLLNKVLGEKIKKYAAMNPDPAQKAADELKASLMEEVEKLRTDNKVQIDVLHEKLNTIVSQCDALETENRLTTDNEAALVAQTEAIEVEKVKLMDDIESLHEVHADLQDLLKRKRQECKELESETGKAIKKKKRLEETERKTAQQCDSLTSNNAEKDKVLADLRNEADVKNEQMKREISDHENVITNLTIELQKTEDAAKAEYAQKFKKIASEKRDEMKALLEEKKKQRTAELEAELQSALPIDLKKSITKKQNAVNKAQAEVDELSTIIKEKEASLPDVEHLKQAAEHIKADIKMWKERIDTLKKKTEEEIAELTNEKLGHDEQMTQLDRYGITLEEQLNNYRDLLHVDLVSAAEGDGVADPSHIPVYSLDSINPNTSSVGVRNNSITDVDLAGWTLTIEYTDEDRSTIESAESIKYTFGDNTMIKPEAIYTVTTDPDESVTHNAVWIMEDDKVDVWGYNNVKIVLKDTSGELQCSAVVSANDFSSQLG
eukprot:CFRG6445T1